MNKFDDYEKCREISKNTFLYRTPLVAASIFLRDINPLHDTDLSIYPLKISEN